MKKINVFGYIVVFFIIWDILGREDMDFYKIYFRDLDVVIGMVIVCLSYNFLIVFNRYGCYIEVS